MGKVIGFAGRIGSGKSELASICVSKGYKRLYFALPLKQLTADLIGVGLDEINGLKNVIKDYSFGDREYGLIADRTSIPFEKVKSVLSAYKLTTVRQILQVIGTDLIREYNIDWHVNELRKMVSDDGNYVFDDVRFPNELAMIREIGGICWFVVRPKLDNVSNHISETAIRQQDCGNFIIVNDGGLDKFMRNWERFMEDYDKSVEKRKELLERGEASDELEISAHMLSYKECEFDGEFIREIIMHASDNVEIVYDNDVRVTVTNPLNIEDLKIFVRSN